MNILPKKRWHVRTKENIARVRKDEAEAAEKERLEKQRIENADREARLSVLKLKSKQKLKESGFDIDQNTEVTKEIPLTSEHINLFANFDQAVKTTNTSHDNEVKEKQEDYEKKIGYLTYLGQDTNEALKKKNWYEVPPESSRFNRSSDIKDTYDKLVLKDKDGQPKEKDTDVQHGEVSWKAKQSLDPINAFKKLCKNINQTITDKKVNKNINEQKSSHEQKDIKKKHKKHKKDKLDKEKLLKLRAARLKREQQEKYKTEMFLSGRNGAPESTTQQNNQPKLKPKYNSQFNPELARQNYR